jgi:hypothetical protein
MCERLRTLSISDEGIAWASLCYSDFLRGNRLSRLATCCGSRGNANNVIARLGTDTIIDPATRWRGEAINPYSTSDVDRKAGFSGE